MILWCETEVNKFATSLFLFITDDSHVSIIWNYRRISKSFLLPNMKYESIKYEAIIWKIRKTKIAYFRWPFSGRSKQFDSGRGVSKYLKSENVWNIGRAKSNSHLNSKILLLSGKFSLEDWPPQNCLQLIISP